MTGDVGEAFNAHREADKVRKERNLRNADKSGWTIHTDYHWSRTLNDKRLDYWPSRNKWQYEGKIMCGNVKAFISKREKRGVAVMGIQNEWALRIAELEAQLTDRELRCAKACHEREELLAALDRIATVHIRGGTSTDHLLLCREIAKTEAAKVR